MKGANMRKLITALLVMGMAMATSYAQQPDMPAGNSVPFSMVVGRAGYFLASDSAYKNIYGNGLVYGLELRIGKKKLVGWLEGSFRSRTGKSSFTQEETKVSIIGVEGGALFRILTGSFSPYLGAGVGYYFFKESNAFIGEASKNGIGFCVLGGASYSVSSWLVLDSRIKYSTCKMRPADFDINIGGLTIGLGIGLRL
jgi:opacity protein-like surface antigen